MSKETYYIKEPYASKKSLLVNFEGETLNLLGKEVEVEARETDSAPGGKKKVKGADQAVLKKLFEDQVSNWKYMIGKKG